MTSQDAKQPKKSPPIVQTPRNTLQRGKKKASYDRDLINAIIDDGYVLHISTIIDGEVRAHPSYYWRTGDEIFIHGSKHNGMYKALLSGAEACLCFTLMDGLVMARSAFHHSLNFRSVVLYAKARQLTDEDERLEALKQGIERLSKGRWEKVVKPSDAAMRGTMILAFKIEEASAKVRSGMPTDDPEDYGHDVWAGVIPCEIKFGDPIEDPNTSPPDEY